MESDDGGSLSREMFVRLEKMIFKLILKIGELGTGRPAARQRQPFGWESERCSGLMNAGGNLEGTIWREARKGLEFWRKTVSVVW